MGSTRSLISTVGVALATVTATIGGGLHAVHAAPPSAQIDDNERTVVDISQDGRYLLTRGSDLPNPLRRIDRSTGTVVEFDAAGNASLSADGSKVFYTDLDGAWVRTISTGVATSVPPPTSGFDNVTVRAMSDDGNSFLVSLGNGATLRNTLALWIPATSTLRPFDTRIPPVEGSIGNQSTNGSISRDGRYTAVQNSSFAGCTSCTEIWVYDRVADTMTLETTRFDGGDLTDGNATDRFDLSDDGRWLVFESDASNIVQGITTTGLRTYVRNLDTNRTVMVSDTAVYDQFGSRPWISDGGGLVALLERRDSVIFGNALLTPQPVIIDAASGYKIPLISGVVPNGDSNYAIVSANGAVAAFTTRADNFTTVTPDDPYTLRSFTAPLQPTLPARLVDTRPTGVTVDGLQQAGGAIPAGGTLVVNVTGRPGAPTSAVPVVLNVTAVNPVLNGFLTVYDCSVSAPAASSLNYTTGQATANMVITKPSASAGQVCIFSNQTTDVIVDLTAWDGIGIGLTPMTPTRILDRRATGSTFDDQFEGGGAVAANTELSVDIGGRGTIPATAPAAIVNITIPRTTTSGFVKVYPCGSEPNASAVNFTANQTKATQTIVKLDATGKLCLKSNQAVEYVADVSGYYTAVDDAFEPLTPARLADTRPGSTTIDGQFQGGGPRPENTSLVLDVDGRGGVTSPRAVVLGIAARDSSVNGFIAVYACGTVRPNASVVNFRTGVTANNTVIVDLSAEDADGRVCVYANRAVNLIVDVQGYFPQSTG